MVNWNTLPKTLWGLLDATKNQANLVPSNTTFFNIDYDAVGTKQCVDIFELEKVYEDIVFHNKNFEIRDDAHKLRFCLCMGDTIYWTHYRDMHKWEEKLKKDRKE